VIISQKLRFPQPWVTFASILLEHLRARS